MEIEDIEYNCESPSGIVAKRDIRDSWGRLKKPKGSIVGCVGSHGYWQLGWYGRTQLIHRVLWETINGPIPTGLVIDHIDGNKLNNSIENIRLVEIKINQRNRKRNIDSINETLGVYRIAYNIAGEERWLWRAEWKDINGKPKSKTFTDKKYGEVAFTLACEYRDKMIQELNNLGAGYTERHTDA
jgi:hypothetical protein